MAKSDNKWSLKFDKFYQGYSPLAAVTGGSTNIGNAGHASSMTSIDILSYPGAITQGPALANLTAGTQAGAITELTNHILDVPPVSGYTFGIGNTKLQQISATAVTNTGNFPHAITNSTGGKTVAHLKGVLYYFYNTASDSSIGTYDLSSSFVDAWQTGLVKATLIPVATKEDIMLFGHGRYVGTYFSSTATINKTKLDFGNNTEVADICYHANYWYIAVNTGQTGTSRNYSQIYTYAGGATTSLLSDEVAVGLQKIGFVFPLNGVIYVAYQDLSTTGGYHIGYISDRKIEPLAHFTGSLPTYAQKTLFNNTILFLSSGLIYSAGAVTPDLPFALSQLADGGYATCGALAAPFGTPMVSSTDGATNYRLAKFSGYDVTSNWTGIEIPISNGRTLGHLTDVVVETNSLGAGARADLTIYYNQSVSNSGALAISTTAKTRHLFKVPKSDIQDIKLSISWANGSASNACYIKSIVLDGHYIRR